MHDWRRTIYFRGKMEVHDRKIRHLAGVLQSHVTFLPARYFKDRIAVIREWISVQRGPPIKLKIPFEC